MSTSTPPTSKPIPPTDHLIGQELERQLAEAQTTLARVREAHAEASFAIVTNVPGSDAKQVASLAKQIAELDAKIGMLVAARSVARKRDQERLAALRLEGQKHRVERVQQLLARRTAYGAELTELLTKAARTFRLLSENSEKVSILSGVNTKAGRLSDAEIRTLTANELYRLAPGMTGRLGPSTYGRFPGAEPADPTVRLQPGATVPLADRLREADEWVARELTRLIAEDQLAPTATAALEALDGPDPIAAAPALKPASEQPATPAKPVLIDPLLYPKPDASFDLKAAVAANSTPTTPAPTREPANRLRAAVRGH